MTAKRTPQEIGKASRNKGGNYERAIVNRFKHIYPKAKRLLECQGGEGYDITGMYPFMPQLKAYKKYAPIGKIEEVPLIEGMIPLLITKGDRKKDVVCMYLSDFIELVEKLEGKML